MIDLPRVSIVMPLFNDEDHVAAALDSCLAQTLPDIEVLCVDDASTDGTVAVVERYALDDARIRLIRQPENRSAFQARRVAIAEARAPFILFLDGDDQLAPQAAQMALAAADSSGADVVGLGVEILVQPGESMPKRFEAALQPRYEQLRAPEIVPRLFPPGEEANGHLWRYLYATRLLQFAYEGVDEDLTFYRANDLPIAFLALLHARHYVSIPDRLYRYHFRRGTSGHAIADIDHFRFFLGGVKPITAIKDRVRDIAGASRDTQAIMESYESARLHIIGNVLRSCLRDTSGELQHACLTLLKEEVGDLEVVRAAAAFAEDALDALSQHGSAPPRSAARSVLLTTAHLRVGGLQGVLIEQAKLLVDLGFKVTVAVMRHEEVSLQLPAGVTLVEVTGSTRLERLDRWLEICRVHHVDVIIDHHILYNLNWPWFVLGTACAGIPTIGWLHNFALRPVFDGTDRSSFLAKHLRLLQTVVALSPTDVAYWKLRGIERVCFLPNPPSELARTSSALEITRTPPTEVIELVWWGRFDPPTKQVQHLIEVAAELRARGAHFRLTIIGPDSVDLTAQQIQQSAQSHGVADAVRLIGNLTPDELVTVLADAHALVMTSAIEGSPLTLVEAQALGLPVIMYDLPWLAGVRGNEGIVTTPPDDRAALADEICVLMNEPAQYTARSHAARDYARSVVDIDLQGLTVALLEGTLPDFYSPTPSLEDARILVEWLVRFSERNTRGGTSTARQVNEIRRERDRARGKLREITEGSSFKIGRAITLLPRTIQGAIRDGRRRGGLGLSKSRSRSVPPPPHAPAATVHAIPHRSDAPDVSFILPVYNAEPWIRASVTSALAQTGVDVEVICINDGSTDESYSILRRLAEADPRVVVVDQANSGQSVGRNRGLDLAKGRYVVFLDSDDYWAGDVLASLVRRADEDDLDLLLFDCICFREGDIDESTWNWYSSYYQRSRAYPDTRSGTKLLTAMRRSGDYRPHVGLYLASTNFVRASGVRFIPGIIHQDNPFTFRLLLNAGKAAHEQIAPYVRRIRPGSTITTLDADRSAKGYFASYLEMKREIDRHDLAEDAAIAVSEILGHVHESARKQISSASEQTLNALRALDAAPDAQTSIEGLIGAARR